MTRATVGLALLNVPDIKDGLNTVRDNEFGYICTNLIQPEILEAQLQEEIGAAPTDSYSWLDTELASSDWRRGVVGIISDLNAELQSGDQRRWKKACELVNQQVNFAVHLNIPAIVVDITKAKQFTSLAQLVNAKLNYSTRASTAFWIKIPMGRDVAMNAGDATEQRHPWNTWNEFRTLCEFHKDVAPVLKLQTDLPTSEEVDRWAGEPVKALFISSDSFLTNTEGFPCLSKAHQRLVKRFMRLKAQVVVEIKPNTTNLPAYSRYIDFLQTTMKQEVANAQDTVENYATGYEDILQIPLQPLRDHLESGTYEVFEKDPVKYLMYEDAIYRAILDRPLPERLVLMVVGAGRGPLVVRSLTAAGRAKREVHIYAVEKNENAVNTLFHHKLKLWGDRVSVVFADMREYNPPEEADIIISELLGSLGDNELSPECLDGAQRFLKPDGVMIPQNYTSFVSPVMSIKYFQDIAGYADSSKPKFSSYETPYIVHMHNVYHIASPQNLFYFEHPNYETERSNDRVCTLRFETTQDCVLNGFSGYFESILYNDIRLSIHPKTHSPGMFSWFPHFLPLREPINVRKGAIISATFWRKSSKTGVWYEWTVTSPTTLGIHNSNGRSITGVMEL